MTCRMAFGVLWVMVLAGLAGCTLPPVRTVEIGDMARFEHKVLIATESSEFKTAVVEGVIEALENDRVYVKMIDVTNLGQERAEEYDGIIILNSCIAWSLSPEVLKFIEALPAKERLVVLVTAGDEEWTPESLAVDAVTSASKMEATRRVTADIIEKIRSAISSRG
ncbi:MAG: hypothetical protein ACOZF0_08275 [Thermodesulfobacteriota bacterium]